MIEIKPKDVFFDKEQYYTLLLEHMYYPALLFITLYKVVLTFESVDEILKCDQSNKSY